jgi:carboxylate-amine ligase
VDEVTTRPEAATWSDWQPSTDYTVGIEEEVMLLDPHNDWVLAPRIDEVFDRLEDHLHQHASAETQDSVLELATDPHHTASSAAVQLKDLRHQLTEQLGPLDLTAACAGTHPSAVWTDTRIAEDERHQFVYGAMRELARRGPTFGLHVHVGVGEPERAITLANRMRLHLPLLLALSANSPFWQGRDTGLASARTPIFQAFPRVGIPRAFGDYDEYVKTVDRLLRVDAFPDPTHLWWDVRPQPKFGTVEIRVMDAQTDNDVTEALVALVQSIAHLELEEGFHDDPAIDQTEVIAENRFLACRDGVDAELIDLIGERRITVRAVVADLLDAARPHAQELGCDAALETITDLAHANGARRQRDVYAEREKLGDVIADLSRRF